MQRFTLYDPSLQMKYEGTSKLHSGVTRYKFVCPRMKWIYDKSTQKSHRDVYKRQVTASAKKSDDGKRTKITALLKGTESTEQYKTCLLYTSSVVEQAKFQVVSGQSRSL